MKCPENDAACGVYYTCSKCKAKLYAKLRAGMTPAQLEYDRRALDHTLHDDSGGLHEVGCSCHINPPCSYCVEKDYDAIDAIDEPGGE